MAEILPGVYIEVRPEALIVSGPVSVGNIGIVGTAAQGPVNEAQVVGSFVEAQDLFGPADDFANPDTPGEPLTLVRALALAYGHGASTVVAVRAANGEGGSLQTALDVLLNEDAHIVVAAGQDESFGDELNAHVTTASNDVNRRDRIAVVGSGAEPAPNADIPANVVNDEGRMIFVAPGVLTTDRASGEEVTLPGAYAAAAVAGMLSGRDPHVSLTNKTLAVGGLERRYTPAQLEQLVQRNVLVLEQRRGFRVVKGVTTSANTAWHQITTRRIVDFAKIGVRRAAESYIGLLNNDRVRKALAGSINGFLAGMVDDEMLVSYDLAVTATRQEEIQGIARVTMTLLPTFSIDFIRVVMFLG
jgi:hypothetical protein